MTSQVYRLNSVQSDGVDVNEIVESARSEPGRQAMKEVSEHCLPTELAELVDRYTSMRASRDPFIWKWVHRLAPQFTFPIVWPDHMDELRTVKTAGTMFLTLLDDILEKERDRPTFQEARKIPFSHQVVRRNLEGVDYEYVEFTDHVWSWLSNTLEAAPRYDEFLELLKYDLRYSINSIEYSYITTEMRCITRLEEHIRRQMHNMMMYPYSDIDLMYGAELPPSDIAGIREAVWHAQHMARFGNWLSTWERELGENDYSSGNVVFALEKGVISAEDLDRLEHEDDDEVYQRIVKQIKESDIEAYFLDQWCYHYQKLTEVNQALATVDIQPYIEGMCEVLRFHLASKGLK